MKDGHKSRLSASSQPSSAQNTASTPFRMSVGRSPSVVSASADKTGGVLLNTRFDALHVEDPDSVGDERSPSDMTYEARHAINSPKFQLGHFATHEDDDVFVSSSKHAGPTMPPALGIRTEIEKVPTPGMLGDHLTSPSVGRVSRDFNSSPIRPLRTRASDIGSVTRHQVGGIDAQQYYPSTACVFVANLPEVVKDNKLELEVTRRFSEFGVVFVKIRRDKKNMPFAFCQYTKDSDAERAMEEETFVMYAIDGSDLTVNDTQVHLAAYGPIARIEPLDAGVQDKMGIEGEAVLVEYKMFDPNRDLGSAFRRHPEYRVVPYDTAKSTIASPKHDTDESWLQRYEIDRRSIYIGNLPGDVGNLDITIKTLVEEIGEVVNVKVHYKEPKTSYKSLTVFAFVEFAHPDAVDTAVKRLAGTYIYNSQLRVERKANRDNSNTVRRTRSFVLPPARESPLRSKPSNGQLTNSAEPFTPFRPAQDIEKPSTDGSALSPATGQASAPGPYPYVAYGSAPYTSPSYTNSPYGGHVPAGVFPATPQATPNVLNPGFPYYPAAYCWPAPYMQDASMAAMYYHAYSSPSHLPSTTQNPTESSTTPTKSKAPTSGDEY